MNISQNPNLRGWYLEYKSASYLALDISIGPQCWAAILWWLFSFSVLFLLITHGTVWGKPYQSSFLFQILKIIRRATFPESFLYFSSRQLYHSLWWENYMSVSHIFQIWILTRQISKNLCLEAWDHSLISVLVLLFQYCPRIVTAKLRAFSRENEIILLFWNYWLAGSVPSHCLFMSISPAHWWSGRAIKKSQSPEVLYFFLSVVKYFTDFVKMGCIDTRHIPY